MQSLTGTPRDGLTKEQVRGVLTAAVVRYQYGVDLVDASGAVVRPVAVSACKVGVDGSAKVPGTMTATLGYRPAATDLLRPWISMTASGVTARWVLGVYLPETPEVTYGRTPTTWTVTGYDFLSALNRPIPETRKIAAGDVVFDAVDALLSDVGFTPEVLKDSTRADATAVAPRTWPADGRITWLQVLDELMTSISYRAAWMDWRGRLRLDRFVSAIDRDPEYEFVVGAPDGIVADTPKVTADVYGQPNRWGFALDAGSGDPVEGSTLYIYDNTARGPSSQRALGRINTAPTVTLDAVNFDDLVVQGDAIVDRQIRATETIELTSRRFPPLWLDNTATFDFGPVGRRKIVSRHWDMDLDGVGGMSSTWETVR